MSSRRLVQRSRQNEEYSPAPQARQQSGNSGARQRAPASRPQPVPLPPYEPPSCPLSAEARRELDSLRLNHDYSKYEMHLKTCKANLTNTTAEVFDRVVLRDEKAMKETAKRRKTAKHEKTREEIEAIEAARSLELHALEVRTKAEKAMRELIDYADEMAMNDSIMKDVIANIPPAPAAEPVRRPRERNGGEDSGDEGEAAQGEEVRYQIPDVPGVSTINLLKDRKKEYEETYTAKDMRRRYENTDYASFIRTVHSAQHGDQNPPPHARLWFTDDGQPAESASFGTQQGNGNDDSDEDIVLAKASVTLKCPLTVRYFVEPYSNKVCTHSFEKSAILEYFRQNGRMHQERDARGKDIGPPKKRVECPQAGCSKFFSPDDFQDDPLLARQVKRAQQEEAREDDSEEDEDDDAPRGGKRARPTQIDSDEVEVDDEEEQRKKHALKVKRERGQSRGMSMAPSHSFDHSMDLDDDDDEEEDDE